MIRASVSVVEPGADGTTSLTVRDGKAEGEASWAQPGAQAKTQPMRKATTAARRDVRIFANPIKCPSYAPTRKAPSHFFKRGKFRIRIGKSPPHLRHLFIGQPERTRVLRFHFGKHTRHISLPIRRPTQHPVEDFFYLVSGHFIDIA